MHIFLYGPPGSGKSTIGKELSKSLALPFVDLDSKIEESTGITIPQIINGQGESVFRDRETAALLHMIKGSPHVIALGGGALLREENRRRAEENGQIIFLEAGISSLLERINRDGNKRPLLAGNVKGKLESLL
jgi:shikimate kinase